MTSIREREQELPLSFHHHILKLPDSVEVFTVEQVGVRRWDKAAVVYDVHVGSDAFLRHYSWVDRWFHINVSLDRSGELVTEPGPGNLSDLEWAFNCDIATPPWTATGDLFALDLFLDVLAAPDGRTFRVKDEVAFAQAVAAGHITGEEAKGARTGLADLIAILQSSGLTAFLDDTCPFSTFAPETSGLSFLQTRAFTDLPMEWRAELQRQRALLRFPG